MSSSHKLFELHLRKLIHGIENDEDLTIFEFSGD